MTTFANCTAFDIIEDLGEEMDIMHDPLGVKWRCWLHQAAYDKLKADTSLTDILELTGDEARWIYEKDGEEYVRVFDNDRIPFKIHMRIAGIDNSLTGYGCRREIDEYGMQ